MQLLGTSQNIRVSVMSCSNAWSCNDDNLTYIEPDEINACGYGTEIKITNIYFYDQLNFISGPEVDSAVPDCYPVITGKLVLKYFASVKILQLSPVLYDDKIKSIGI